MVTERILSEESFHSLPKGCSEIEPTRVNRFMEKLFRPSDQLNKEEWQNKWASREKQARLVLELGARVVLSGEISQYAPGLDNYLDGTEPQTGLSYRTLLARGIEDLKENRFIIATSNNLGLDMGKGLDSVFAFGGQFEFMTEFGRRHAEGTLAGILLNVESKGARVPKSNQVSDEITGVQLSDIIKALINIQLELLRTKEENIERTYTTQQDLDAAINWVLFSPELHQ